METKDFTFVNQRTIKMKAPKRYCDFKKEHPNTICFFRVGNFYECYAKDAMMVARLCSKISVVNKSGIVNLGFPCYELDKYLFTLVIDNGLEVAYCDEWVD